MTAVQDASVPLIAPILRSRPGWLLKYQVALVALDGTLLGATVLVAVVIRFPSSYDLRGVPYFLVAALVGLVWWAALALTRSYESRFLGEGPEEFKRVAQASVRIAAALGIVCYLGKLPLSRGFVAIALSVGTLSLITGRFVARDLLRRRRRRGAWSHRVVVVGAANRVAELVAQLGRTPEAGFNVVGACVPGGQAPSLNVPDLGALTEVGAVVARTKADTVAVTSWSGMSAAALRELAYELEGPGVDLLVAPSLINVAGSRVRIRPLAGLPLLHLDEVELSGTGRVAKGVMDRAVAGVLLLLLWPLLLGTAALVRLSSQGPVVLAERRLGKCGALFNEYRFRCHRTLPTSSRVDVHSAIPVFQHDDQGRFTRVGRWLDRSFLNDLPLLVNVLKGQLSLVGPRAVRPGRGLDALAEQRRLLVKPGLTGLAQISGRKILSTEEALRLDQQYVDNWSFGLDALVLVKTAGLLLNGRRLV